MHLQRVHLQYVGVIAVGNHPIATGGYLPWHRDMPDVNSAAVSFPADGRLVKAIIYFEDCPPNGGANAVVLGSHRLPFGPGEWSIFMFLPSSL